MMFHIAYMYARRLHRCTDILIEVNPRHVRFYRSMLGFEVLGPERTCPRVNAPAVLLRLRLDHAQEQLAREAYRLRRLHQEVVAGLAERRLVETPADPSPTRHWCV